MAPWRDTPGRYLVRGCHAQTLQCINSRHAQGEEPKAPERLGHLPEVPQLGSGKHGLELQPSASEPRHSLLCYKLRGCYAGLGPRGFSVAWA